MVNPVVFPPTTIRTLPGGTSLVGAQPNQSSSAAVMTTESFDAPEGTYTCTSRFTPPPQPMIHLNPLPQTQAQLLTVYPTPRVSTVSLRYPASSKNYKAAEKQKQQAAAAQAMVSSTLSDSTTSSNDALGQNSAYDATSANPIGPIFESPLAAQGIDAPGPNLTGGLAAGNYGPAAGIAGIGGVGMGFSGLGESMGKLSAKPSRPKNNLKNTSSNFVNRMMTHPDLTKILAARTDTEHFTFLNNARSFFWLADTNGKTKESLARITFSASPSSHDVNQFTRSPDRLDIVIGFVTGDIIWLDPIASRYSRINKGGCITSSAVTQVRWLPGSESLFMAAHADGSLMIYDRDREDSTDFVPATWDATPVGTALSSTALQAVAQGSTPSATPMSATQTTASDSSNGQPPSTESRPILGQRTITASTATTNDAAETITSTSSGSVSYRKNKQLASAFGGPLTDRRHAGSEATENQPLLLVTKPGLPPIASGLPSGSSISSEYQQAAVAATAASAGNVGTSGKGKETLWSRMNPVSHWAASKTRITDFAFSPDFSHVAIVAEDGILRIADINTERLLDTFESYFGGLHCVAWSPDGKFVLTGGQDDLVTVWAPREGRIVARCQGHTSFVTALAWDPWRWSSDDRTYRFASVGEDCKLILWDFSSAALNRPKSHAPHAGPGAARRSSTALGSTYSLVDRHSTTRSPGSALGNNSRRFSSGFDHSFITEDTLRHPALPRSEVAILQPVVTVDVDGEIPASIRFGPDKLVILRRNAAVDTFTRPTPRRNTGGDVSSASAGSSIRSAMQQSASTSASKPSRLPGLSLGFGNSTQQQHQQQQQATTPTSARFPSGITA